MKKEKHQENLGQIETTKGKTFDIAELFHIDETDLDTEFRTQAGWYAYFSNQLAHAEYLLAQAKSQREVAYAEADVFYREEFEDKGRKITEPTIKAEVLLDEVYHKAVEHENVMTGKRLELLYLVRALSQRADMLISLGAHRRAEMDMTGMNIREQGYQKMQDDLKETISKRKKEQV